MQAGAVLGQYWTVDLLVRSVGDSHSVPAVECFAAAAAQAVGYFAVYFVAPSVEQLAACFEPLAVVVLETQPVVLETLPVVVLEMLPVVVQVRLPVVVRVRLPVVAQVRLPAAVFVDQPYLVVASALVLVEQLAEHFAALVQAVEMLVAVLVVEIAVAQAEKQLADQPVVLAAGLLAALVEPASVVVVVVAQTVVVAPLAVLLVAVVFVVDHLD